MTNRRLEQEIEDVQKVSRKLLSVRSRIKQIYRFYTESSRPVGKCCGGSDGIREPTLVNYSFFQKINVKTTFFQRFRPSLLIA